MNVDVKKFLSPTEVRIFFGTVITAFLISLLTSGFSDLAFNTSTYFLLIALVTYGLRFIVVGLIKSVAAEAPKQSLELATENDLKTLNQSIMAADNSIRAHNNKSNIYLSIIAVLVIGFIYFIFFSITSDISVVNNYVERQSRINFAYENYFKEYVKLIEKRALLSPYIKEVDIDEARYYTMRNTAHRGNTDIRLIGRVPAAILESVFQTDSVLRWDFGVAEHEVIKEYHKTQLRISAVNEIIRKIDKEDVQSFWGGDAKLDTLYTSSIFPSNNIKLSETNSFMMYLVFGVFVLVFGVFMALYRNEIKEISHLEALKFGFLRVRIAGSNFDREGFKSEVREALTKSAFGVEKTQAGPLIQKKQRIESPLPGHPSSDLVALILSKVLDNMDSLYTRNDNESGKKARKKHVNNGSDT